MYRLSFIFAISLFFSSVLPVSAQKAMTSKDEVALNKNLVKRTVVYAKKGGENLKMDIISRLKVKPDSPCIIFVFGGSFARGQRDQPTYNTYFNRMAEEGYVVVSIDYRLGLKDRTGLSMDNVAPLGNAIRMAVEDVYDATAYLLKNAKELHINPRHIILSGSSAGAITVLSADWGKRNYSEIISTLPSNFQYAGVISFAGALLSMTGLPEYKINPAPTMLFHGTQDSLVLYRGMSIGNNTLLGSSNLAELFAQNNYPYYIKRYEGMGHEIAKIPMRDDLDQIVWFIRKYVLEKQKYKLDTSLDDPERERTDYSTLRDLL